MDVFVKVRKGDNPFLLSKDILAGVIEEDIKGKSVLLKPNVGFIGKEKSGLCTHPEVIRGLIHYLKEKEVGKIYVGDSSVIGVDTMEALVSAGIFKVCEEEGVVCMDLNDSNPVDMKISNGNVVDSILLSSIVYEVDIIISVGVMKTHMHTGASLSIKNMKGAMYRREKNKLHRLTRKPPKGATERSLDFGILDLTTVMYPDYSVIDGIVGMEGFGPSGGTSKEVGLILASKNPVACDMIALQLMGLALEDVGHIKLISEHKGINYEDINVDPKDYIKYQNKFQTPAEARLELSCDALVFEDESACSACHATLTQFLRYHSDKFSDETEPIYIFAGKDIDPEEIKSRGDRAYLLGACTHKFKDIAPYCKGCPPVTSELLKIIKKMTGVTVNFLGDGSFNISTKDYRIFIDPKENLDYRDAKPTHILISKNDEKILRYSEKLQKETNCEIYGLDSLKNIGYNLRINDGNIGGSIGCEFGSIKFINTAHKGIDTVGYLLNIEGIICYFVGETALSYDMKLLENEEIDILILPVGNHITMGIKDATTLISWIKPKFVVPMKYNNSISDTIEIKDLEKEIKDLNISTQLKILNVGDFFSHSNEQEDIVANAGYEGGIL